MEAIVRCPPSLFTTCIFYKFTAKPSLHVITVKTTETTLKLLNFLIKIYNWMETGEIVFMLESTRRMLEARSLFTLCLFYLFILSPRWTFREEDSTHIYRGRETFRKGNDFSGWFSFELIMNSYRYWPWQPNKTYIPKRLMSQERRIITEVA